MTQQQTIKAIETFYNGHRFRSRVEARWAVFFDNAGIQYSYEYEGFDLNGIWYLPDFQFRYMCGCHVYVEIKGQLPTAEEERKALRVCVADRHTVCILCGDVWPDRYVGFAYIPISLEPEKLNGFLAYLDSMEGLKWKSPTEAILLEGEGKDAIPLFMANVEIGFMCVNTAFVSCPKCNAVFLENVKEMDCGCSVEPCLTSPLLRSAYVSARSARFEHGEKP